MVPIATYGYRLWYFNGARNKGAMNQLKRMQQKAALWITGAFCTSPTGGLQALAGLIPVHLMLKKLAMRAVYHVATLSDTHPLCSMIGKRLLKWANPHARSAALMTPAMWGKVKSTVMEVDERTHTLTESFEPFAPEARPDCLCFDEHDPTQDRCPYLNELIANARANPFTVLAAADSSVFARVCQCITGHMPIRAYYRRFKINEPHGCTCGAALQDIASFLKHNPMVFGFNWDPSGVG
ncbi:unnamed protein product [Cyclocybe aegerita]|uniref:Uncharacterized protein n=1 Tax=Cyclocybe aegerita TaxID=1973307 RepID=A0A8S0WSM2_CYCAE|nr:unnamed protein product [Cyclocybe aegerita]